jgi:O-antigen ligase
MYKKFYDYLNVDWMMPAFMLSFGLPRQIQTWLLLVLAFGVLLQSIKNRGSIKSSEFIIVVLFAVLYIPYLISYLRTDTDHSARYIGGFVETKAGLLAVPLLLVFMLHSNKESWRKYLPWFVWAVIFKMIWAHIMLFSQLNVDVLTLNHVTYRRLFEQNAQMHPTSYGVYAGFSIAILFFEAKSMSFWMKAWAYVLLFLSTLLLLPKMPFLALMLVHLMFIFYTTSLSIKKRAMITGAFVAGLSLLIIFIPIVKQRILEFWPASAGTIDNSVQVRKIIFQTDLNLLEAHWLKGLGPYELQRNLDLAMYFHSAISRQALGTYNTHNEYLNYWLSFGLLGFIILLAVLLIFLYWAIKRKDVLYISLMILLLCTFLTENWLSVQHGVLFFAGFGSLFFIQEKSGLKGV